MNDLVNCRNCIHYSRLKVTDINYYSVCQLKSGLFDIMHNSKKKCYEEKLIHKILNK